MCICQDELEAVASIPTLVLFILCTRTVYKNFHGFV